MQWSLQGDRHSGQMDGWLKCMRILLISIRLFNLSSNNGQRMQYIFIRQVLLFISPISGSPCRSVPASLVASPQEKSIRSHLGNPPGPDDSCKFIIRYLQYKCSTFWGFMHCLIRQFMAPATHSGTEPSPAINRPSVRIESCEFY